MKVEVLKDFAWYRKGQIIETVKDSQFYFLEKLGFVREVK